MNIKYICTLLAALLLCSACSSNEIDSELEGRWALEQPKDGIKSLMFQGELLGINGKTYDTVGFEGTSFKVFYSVKKNEWPFKLYQIIHAYNRRYKIPFGIYRIYRNEMTLCFAEKKQKMLYGKPISKPKAEFPETFTKKCRKLKRI